MQRHSALGWLVCIKRKDLMTRDPHGLMTWKRFYPLDALLLLFVHIVAGWALYLMGDTAYHIVAATEFSWVTIWSIAWSLWAIAWALVKAGFGFSWSTWAMFWLIWVMTLLGVSVYSHRCKTHLAFKCNSAWFEKTLAACQAVGFVRSALGFCTNHAQHHTYTDEPGDPHSPTEFGGGALGFWWAYILCTVFDPVPPPPGYRTPKHIAEDPVLIWQDKYFFLLAVGLGFALPFVVIGFFGMHFEGFFRAGLHGMPLIFLRLVATWHPAFMVNSIGHRFGTRAVRNPNAPESAPKKYFDTRRARNFPLFSLYGTLGVFTGGESWHGNHHGRQTCAYLGWEWWEIDPGREAIRLFEKLGLVENVEKPRRPWTTLPDAA